jgi:hypothetical protein
MKNNEIDPKLKDLLDELKPVPQRNPSAAARGRSDFLTQASNLRAAEFGKQATRKSKPFPASVGKARIPVLRALIAVTLALAVFFGAGGVTVYAAQDSLPNESLYPVKTWSEDALLALSGSPQARLNYELEFTDRRITEMAGLAADSTPIPEAVLTRLQDQLDQALELAAGLDDGQMAQQVEHMRQRAESQLQMMNTLMAGASETDAPVLLRAQVRLQEQLQYCMLGAIDPQGFRMQVQQRRQYQGDAGMSTPGAGAGTPDASTTPNPAGNGNGQGGNQPDGTPGECSPNPLSPDKTPQSGSGSGHKP